MTTKQTTKNDYVKRIAKVTDYIHKNLDKELSLDELAKVSCFSEYHWQRIYKYMVGESVKRTIRRNRLQLAAKNLVKTNLTIGHIAGKAGYDSQYTFSRRFKEDFGVTPSAYRKKNKLKLISIKHPCYDNPTLYDVSFEQLESLRLASCAHYGDYLDLGQAFEKLFPWAVSKQAIRPEMRLIGVFYDDSTVVPVEKLRSIACITVPEHSVIEEGVEPYQLNKGLYAVITHQGCYSELECAYQWLYGDWLPNSGYAPGPHPIIEEFLNDPREVPPSQLLTKIYISLSE